MALYGGNGTAGDGPVAAACNTPVKGLVHVVVPGAGRTAQEDIAGKENGSDTKKLEGRGACRCNAGGVHDTDEIGKVKRVEARRTFKSHELSVRYP